MYVLLCHLRNGMVTSGDEDGEDGNGRIGELTSDVGPGEHRPETLQ